jgi:hypothetical protein
MTDTSGFDKELAHKFFAAACFNNAWELIDKSDRTAEDDEQMIRLTHASMYHWTQRPDCTDRNFSIGYWQASRVYCLVGQAENALRYAQLCLEITPQDDAFCLGYAYEALARAEQLAGNEAQSKEHLEKAREQAAKMSDEQDRKYLEADLKSLE